MEHQETINDSTEIDWDNGDQFLILPKSSSNLLRAERAGAAMARSVSEDEYVKVIKDKSVAIVDCATVELHSPSPVRSSMQQTLRRR